MNVSNIRHELVQGREPDVTVELDAGGASMTLNVPQEVSQKLEVYLARVLHKFCKFSNGKGESNESVHQVNQ